MQWWFKTNLNQANGYTFCDLLKVFEILEKEGNELVINLQETCSKVQKALANLHEKVSFAIYS